MPLLDARRLRELGEFADGFREEDLVVFADPVGAEFAFRIMSAQEASTARTMEEVKPLLRVRTKARIPGRVVPEVKMFVNGREATLPANFDSLFWTESAIEKFLFPYYEQLRIFDDEFLSDLKKAYFNPITGKRIIAFAHIPPSQPDPIHDPNEGNQVRIVVDRRDEIGEDQVMTAAAFLGYIQKFLAQAASTGSGSVREPGR